jgi:hypothetical protein
VAVDEDDFIGLRPGHRRSGVATGVPHPHHVLGELRLAFDAAFALRHHEGLEAFGTQAAQHFDGGNVGVAL